MSDGRVLRGAHPLGRGIGPRARGLSALARWAARNGRPDEAVGLTDKAAEHQAEADRLWAAMGATQRQAALDAEAQRWAEWEAQRAERAEPWAG